MVSIVAYAYEAAMHCPDCTRARFARPYALTWHPRDMHGLPDYPERDSAAMRDREGNPVRPVWSIDDRNGTDYCDTCRARFDV